LAETTKLLAAAKAPLVETWRMAASEDRKVFADSVLLPIPASYAVDEAGGSRDSPEGRRRRHRGGRGAGGSRTLLGLAHRLIERAHDLQDERDELEVLWKVAEKRLGDLRRFYTPCGCATAGCAADVSVLYDCGCTEAHRDQARGLCAACASRLREGEDGRCPHCWRVSVKPCRPRRAHALRRQPRERERERERDLGWELSPARWELVQRRVPSHSQARRRHVPRSAAGLDPSRSLRYYLDPDAE
jgi:hypothetical protein